MDNGLVDGFLYRANTERGRGEKAASILLGGGGLHVGTNAVMKLVKTTGLGKKLLHGAFDKGYNLGFGNRRISPVIKNTINYGVGPEALLDHGMGSFMGRFSRIRSKAKTPHQVASLERFADKKVDEAVAKHLTSKGHLGENSFATNEFKRHMKDLIRDPKGSVARLRKEVPVEVQKAPLLESMFSSHYKVKPERDPRSYGKLDPRRLLTVHGRGKAPVSDVAAKGVLGAGMFASPHAAIQMGISRAREIVSNSKTGRKFMLDQFEAGTKGREIPKLTELANDYLLSPAALDPRRIGLAINKGYNRKYEDAIKSHLSNKG